MTSLTEENYLKTIYSLIHSKGKKPSTNSIAELMETKASSVTDMLKRLNEKQLVDYQKYKAVKLTEEGKKVAISIIRKHRLWEYFLVEKLNFGWDEVHDVAEQLEHIQSVKLTNELDAFLEYPEFDPHGDPIPNSEGKFPNRKNQTLAESSVKNEVIITGVEDHSSNFLNYLTQLNIQLGTKIKVLDRFSFDNSVEIQINDTKHTLSEKVTKNLYIKSI